MCTLATELHTAWVPLPWDYIFCRVDHSVTCILPGAPANTWLLSHWVDGNKIQGKECCGSKVEHIWLPRQDQLQAFIFIGYRRIGKYFNRFSIFADGKHASSPEQLWLRYYMSLKYKKVWHTDTWLRDPRKHYG